MLKCNLLKPRRCNNTVDLTTSVDKGLKCFNLVLIWFYDTKSNLVQSRGDPALLTTPLTWKPEVHFKYTLGLVIGWVLPRLESQSHVSHGRVPYVSWVSPMWLDTLFCESHVYHKIIGVIYMHWAYIWHFWTYESHVSTDLSIMAMDDSYVRVPLLAGSL